MRPLVTLLAAAFLGGLVSAGEPGRDIVECKITLPNGESYFLGPTDPVANLDVSLTLTNTSPAEKRAKEDVQVRKATHVTQSPELYNELHNTEVLGSLPPGATPEQIRQAIDEKIKNRIAALTTQSTIQVDPVNKESAGIAYTPPALGPHDLVRFVIVKLPDDGAAPPEGAKQTPLARDMAVEYTAHVDRCQTAYLAAGETSPAYVLPAGRFYRVTLPGRYSLKAVLASLPDSRTPSGRVESNTVEFRVLPFKVLDTKIADLRAWWADFERGRPEFPFMVYQLRTHAQWQEIYYVQRMEIAGQTRWEWRRLCSVEDGSTVQVKQVTPTKLAILAKQARGDLGLYTLDFATREATVQSLPAAGPNLVVEGDRVEAK